MRLIGFLQAWDLLRDELGRAPTPGEYAERFRIDRATAESDLAAFERAFGTGDPGEVLDMLWDWRRSRVKRSPEMPIGSG